MSNGEISPAIPSGFRRMRFYILFGLVYLTFVYVLVIREYRSLIELLAIPPPEDEYCPESISGCIRGDLFAFEVASGQALLFAAVVGFVAWHVTRAPMTKLPSTPEGRLFGYIPEADWLTAAAFTFQVWDFVISLMIPECRTAIMLAHHLMAGLVAWYGLNNQVRDLRL